MRIDSPLPDLPWGVAAASLLAETDKTSAKAVCVAIGQAADDKATKAAAMSATADLANWARSAGVHWVEPYLVASLFPAVMTLCADKTRAVQAAAEEAGSALVAALHTAAYDAMLPLLFKEFAEHRWQTKLAAVGFFGAMARASPQTVAASLPSIVGKLMEVSQDPKPAIKEAATVALREACAVITNPDVMPLIDEVIAANLDPEARGESCLDRLVATTFVSPVDEPTLSIIVPVLLRSLKVRGNAATVRKAAVVVETMCKLVNEPAHVACFADELLHELGRNLDEVSVAEVRGKVDDALGALKQKMWAHQEGTRECSPAEVEALLSEAIGAHAGGAADAEVIGWVSRVAAPLFASDRCSEEIIASYLLAVLPEAAAAAAAASFFAAARDRFAPRVSAAAEGEADGNVLCDCEFSLAYGNRVLLHNTPLKLQRGKCYGLIGPNGAGKSTLMRSIAAEALDGFPRDIRSVYVECDVSAACAELSCVDFVGEDEIIKGLGKTKDDVFDMMVSVGFKEELARGPVGSLSGGWRMRLALSRAMLKAPELLLLDEPTNHVDSQGVAWLTKYLQDLGNRAISSMIVSHDSAFLDAVAQHMVHFEPSRKLKVYAGNLSEFVKLVPEAAAYYTLASDHIAFTFPEPGMLEGVTSRTKALIKMSGADFRYPGANVDALSDASVQVSMASRVAVVGPNGAGKSTLVKLLVGEILPSNGAKVEKHQNLRLAYVAQHAFHHIENHLDKTPMQYLEWRFTGGVDAESVALNALALDEAEAALVGRKKGQVDKLLARRKAKKGFEYEVLLVGAADPTHDTEWIGREELLKLKWVDPEDKKKRQRDCGPAMAKLMAQVDERAAFAQSGVGEKKLTAVDVQAHFDRFNLESQFGSHAKISALSGGQKVKVVLAAAMWMEPHVIILDEPTNFLDRDSLGALATALKAFGGGVLLISHQKEFYSALCSETWAFESGRCVVTGSDWWDGFEKARKKEAEKAAKAAEKAAKAAAKGGGKADGDAPKVISKLELKKLKKRVAEQRAKGEEVLTDDEIAKAGYALEK